MDEFTLLNQDAVDLLSATIVRRAYEDLLDAYLIDAAVEWHDVSFNCYVYYKKLRSKKPRYQARTVDIVASGGTAKEQQYRARREIKRLTEWFTRSERCRMLLKRAKGEWFVEQARARTKDFVLDKVMQDELHVVLNHVDGQTERTRKKRYNKWRKERDAWRKEKGLSEVKDV